LMEYLFILFWVMIFGLQHSGLSALRIKSGIITRWASSGYSKIYKITSVLALLPPFFAMNFWDWLYFLHSPELLTPLILAIAAGLIIPGIAIASLASRALSVSSVADMRTDRQPELVTRGIYSRIRHPMYLATILLFLGLIAVYPFPRVAVFSLSFCLYILIGAKLEERKLVIRYGQEYLDYRKRAGSMLPSRRTK